MLNQHLHFSPLNASSSNPISTSFQPSRHTMALPVHWYDFVCFGIVGVAFLGSLWVLWRKEIASKNESNTVYESLLVAGTDADGLVDVVPLNHVGSSQLWTTCWKGLHPGWLLATRFTSFLVLGGFLLWDLADWDASTLVMYYTEWTYALVMLYFAIASVTSAYGIWFASNKTPQENGENGGILRGDVEDLRISNSLPPKVKKINGSIKLQSHYAREAIESRAGLWGYLMQTVYQTSAGAVILTDIVFWCIIVPFGSNAHLGLNVLMGCLHSLNCVFLVLDTALNNLPFPWFRFAYFVQWSCLYVVFQWVVHACGLTWWPYPFLELDIPWAPLWYFALAVVHIPCYGVYALIVKAKNSILPQWFPNAFVRSY